MLFSKGKKVIATDDSIKIFNVFMGFIDEKKSVTAQELLDVLNAKLNGVKGLKLLNISVNSMIQSAEGNAKKQFMLIKEQEKQGKKTLVIVDAQQELH